MDYGRGSWGGRNAGAIEKDSGSAMLEGVGLDREMESAVVVPHRIPVSFA